jgi:lysophospholipid acyltransferase (LPLAT)-like uncharacterized protein
VSRDRIPAWTGVAAWAGSLALHLLGGSWRVVRLDADAHDARLAAGERCIYALWHARLLPLVYTHRGQGAGVLVSRHRDGELITRIIQRLGYAAARGSSTRGGDEGLREMLSFAESGHLLAITPDGPRGPAEHVKPGLVYLASKSGVPVVPVAAGAKSTWRLRSWDGFRVPRPFARVTVAYGAPIRVPADLDAAETERWRREIEAAISNVTDTADRHAQGAA